MEIANKIVVLIYSLAISSNLLIVIHMHSQETGEWMKRNEDERPFAGRNG